MSQTASTQEKINLKYASSSAVRPGQTFGYGQVTTGQVSSRKYEILARASSVGRFEDREGLNPEMMMRAQSQSTSAQRLRRVKLIILRYCFCNLPWVISECPAPFVDDNIAQGWLQTGLNTGTLALFCQF